MYYSGHKGASAPPYLSSAPNSPVHASSQQSVTFFRAFVCGTTSRHNIGGALNLISIHSYETFQGYILMVFKISFGSTTAAVCITNGLKWVGKKERKKKVTNTIERIYSYFGQISLSG